MKTITIPKRFGYPTLDITVNGETYKVKSGEEITIEDHVAEVIENALELEPKPKRYLTKIARLIDGSLEEITAEDMAGISDISSCAFYTNLGLKKVTIPENIRKIKANSFAWCTNLTSVFLPPMPPELVDVKAFNSINADCIFYCKSQESLEAYKKAANWSTLTGTYTFVVESK